TPAPGCPPGRSWRAIEHGAFGHRGGAVHKRCSGIVARMTQLPVRAEPGSVAPVVLLPCGPDRATPIAETLLDAPRLYNEHRHLLGYTGGYGGVEVSVQSTGMGCPSMAIVVEELIRLGARRLVRIGTCGAIAPQVSPGDLVVA